MTAWNPQREARSHGARAGAYTKAAEREARQAAEAYETARRWRRQAAQLTQTPRLWFDDYTPASLEAAGDTWERVGDTWLSASFHDTEMAAQYREMAAETAARGR